MWERELEIIESLGKLYPEFPVKHNGLFIKYKNYQENNYFKADWIYFLCTLHLNQRIPRLEEFIKVSNDGTWWWYKKDFKITEKQCGKKN